MKDMIRRFTEKETQTTLQYGKKCSVSLKIKDTQLKHHSGHWQKIPSLPAYSAGEAVEKQTLVCCGWACVSIVYGPLGYILPNCPPHCQCYHPLI